MPHLTIASVNGVVSITPDTPKSYTWAYWLINVNNSRHVIEYDYPTADGLEGDYMEIGLWLNGKTRKVLADYDGCGILPAMAIRLLRAAGIRVPKDFE